jgi:DNA invertase Pin-like site-specific DNA recombinase
MSSTHGSRMPEGICYAAKSSADPRNSIGTQLADARQLAQREGLEVVGEYQDESFSAYSRSRGPGLEAAMEHAERIGGTLIVQHSDRLARGDVRTAMHLVEYVIWAIKANVTLRSVQDDDAVRDLLYAAVNGQRNHEDSRRKSDAVQAGLRRTAERGEWPGGVLADGYRIIVDSDEHGRVTKRVEKDPQRAPIYELIFDRAKAGWSVDSIVLELDRLGHRTAPRRKNAKPRPFDSNRVRQTLNMPFYAGLVVHQGEVLDGAVGQWPRFIEPVEFERLRQQRRQRAGHRRGPGRPPEGYLLSGIARCGACGGPMYGVTGRGKKNQRKDGTWPKRYVCRAHREHPSTHSDYCPAKPIDAAVVDLHFVAHLDRFLGDVTVWRDQLAGSRVTEIERLEGEAQRARQDAAESERVAAKMQARYDAALAADDDATADAVLAALVARRAEHQRAGIRLAAALDALESVAEDAPVDPLLDFYNRLSAELTGRLAHSHGDLKRTNALLRECFQSVTLTAEQNGTRMSPMLSNAAFERVAEHVENFPAYRVENFPAKQFHVEKMQIKGVDVDVTAVTAPGAVALNEMPPLREIVAGRNASSPWWLQISAGGLALPEFTVSDDSPR